MTLASPALTIDDSWSLPDLPFAAPTPPQVPVRAIVQVDLRDGVRYQQECGHRTWWAGRPDRTPRVGQLHGCISCWAELLDSPVVPHSVTVAMPTYADPVTPVNLLANFNDFRKWLAGKAPTAAVGEAQASGSCPISTYLGEAGVDTPVVSRAYAEWGCDDEGQELGTAPLPKWAQRFVDLVDQHPAHAEIRASLAMTLLYEAVRESIGDDR